VVAILAYLLRLGSAVNFFSETVLVGFKAGLALFLASTQLPKLFGFAGAHGDFWENMAHFLGGLPQTNPASLVFGVAALILLLLGKVFIKNRPVALVVLAASIVAAGILRIDQHGVALLGEVPRGVPLPRLPMMSRADVTSLLPLALACFLLAAVETSAIGRMFAAPHAYRLDASREFLAIGGANLAAALGGGFVVSGGSSQSLVNESAGARSPMSGLFAALITLGVVLFLTGLLRDLPQPVVAAIVLSAVTGLVDVRKLREIWHFSRGEFGIAAAAFFAVLAWGLLDGVLVGVAISILLLIRRAARPRVTEVGRVPHTAYFADLRRHPENERIPDVVVVRPEGSLVYFNVDYVRDRLNELVASHGKPRIAILPMSNVPYVDFAGAEMLVDLYRAFEKQGISVRLAEARGGIRDAIRRLGAPDAFRGLAANLTVADVLS